MHQSPENMNDTEFSENKLQAGGRHDMPAPLLPHGRRSGLRCRADGNIAAVSHGQHVPMSTEIAS